MQSFVEKMQKGLSKGKLANIVFIDEVGDNLIVRFEKFGTSKIIYKIIKDKDGFQANFQRESVFFAHGVFRMQVEKKLVDMMIRFGATVE